MPDIKTMQKMVKRLEEAKGFSKVLNNKLLRLKEEVEEVLNEKKDDKIAEELIDCIFFIVSALSILGVDGDSIFMKKYRKNMSREKGKGLDTFKK